METKAPQTTKTCVACGKNLRNVFSSDPGGGLYDNRYQFEDSLWIGFHGGYGMFLDNFNATIAENEFMAESPEELTYKEERLLPGQPDYEAVICHDCAHELCEKVPWIKSLLEDPKHNVCMGPDDQQ